jgi:hypothetical protein
LCVLFLKDGGFLPNEFNTLLYILMPRSCLLLALFNKYIAQNRYQRPGPLLTGNYVGLGLFFLLFLHLAELSLIVYRGLYGSPEGGQFFLDIALLESCTAAYAGFYLSELFTSQ